MGFRHWDLDCLGSPVVPQRGIGGRDGYWGGGGVSIYVSFLGGGGGEGGLGCHCKASVWLLGRGSILQNTNKVNFCTCSPL